jgi:RNA recognition motif-containing protein
MSPTAADKSPRPRGSNRGKELESGKMNIFVGNLSYSTTEEKLQTVFEAYGEVSSVKILRDRETDRPRGFGFVEMPNDEQAQDAIDALNGKEFDGRALRVNKARERSDSDRRPPSRRQRW